MVMEAESICQKSIPSMLDVKYHLCVAQEHNVKVEISPTNPSVQIFTQVRVSSESLSTETSSFESAVTCSEITKDSIMETPATKFTPNVRSASYAETGPRVSMEDEHILIDDVAAHLGFVFQCPIPSVCYAVFDGHGGPDAANFEDANMLRSYDTDAFFMKKLEESHRRAFLRADLALADEQSVNSSCGTTTLGSHLLVANAGDCRAVLCRRGKAVEMWRS
ncbi:PREDICTED: probable protein phosphatase 2C 47 [Lupinus angustifolius]|uniref:probable protein phosphatase 2C 47 n=1 Tax=Lupinus angustifolius TaxID=3871 RepID=UPI00092E784B|nr:PREDICTED: probable protein phosphatase 2C 47 [Lupinus angustifolius]